ncbi:MULTISPECIES: DUF4124 domain-containing protein [unclassified Microbulbifer]|uniref:DUF4124 domain-containing protein n=1 Tax=unclassified Microbulbifer TaxID=2619833 RepID=UPI0027E5750B|nr:MULTISPECIES: DUF4124 domain-containing protein [unclassified Microbulbifer]
MRIALAALITGLAMAAQADGIYKWEDENGVVHFGSQPPPQKEQVEVVKKPKSDRYKQWESEQQALMAQQRAKEQKAEAEKQPAAKAETKPEPQKQAGPSPAELAIRAQRCQQARGNLQELQTHSRVREVDASGNLRVLGEEERQERIARAQQTIRENC